MDSMTITEKQKRWLKKQVHHLKPVVTMGQAGMTEAVLAEIELALDHPGKLHGGQFEEKIIRIESAVEDSFVQTKKCFEEGDADFALELLDKYAWVNDLCDEIVVDVVKEKDTNIRPGDAAALAVYVRWLKRINSHLRNLTTRVSNPFDRIGFQPKKK